MIRLRATVVEVDLGAIRHNVRALKPATAELMAVVKGNAYGHGDVPVARAAIEAGATWLGVALVEEGIHLREAGISAPILVLSEFPRGAEKEALAAKLTPTLYTDEGLLAVAEAAEAVGGGVPVHVKIDTGMHRAGVYPAEAAVAFASRVVGSGLRIEGLFTHLARSEEDVTTTLEQLRRFRSVATTLAETGIRPRYLHAANSAAVLRFPETHLDLVRPGIALYGVSPGPDVDMGSLRPALSWRSAVALVKRLPAGEAVSYGHRYRLQRESTIATVPVGYADGYRRSLSSRADVLIRGRRRRVAGAVTMDQILVDCGGEDPIEPGDEVVLLGRQGHYQVSAVELGDLAGTLGYEIVSGIGERVPREYLG